VVIVVVTDEGNKSALAAGKLARAYFGPIEWLQSDNGSEYNSHFDKLKSWWKNRRRITPGKKEENGCVESFNRTLRKECVGWGHYTPEPVTLQDLIHTYVDEYHTERPHLSLTMQTPKDVYLSHLRCNCAPSYLFFYCKCK
jgi:transposase InsO family protein